MSVEKDIKDMKVINIGDKSYDSSTITEDGNKLIEDLKKIDQHTSHHHMAIQISNIAKSKIIDELKKEAEKHFTEVVSADKEE